MKWDLSSFDMRDFFFFNKYCIENTQPYDSLKKSVIKMSFPYMNLGNSMPVLCEEQRLRRWSDFERTLHATGVVFSQV